MVTMVNSSLNGGFDLMLTNQVYVFSLHCVASVSLFIMNRSALPTTTHFPPSKGEVTPDSETGLRKCT